MVIKALRSLEWSQVVCNYFEENKNLDIIFYIFITCSAEINDFIFSIMTSAILFPQV